MIDLSMGELLVIGTVALVVIGPKDLPELFRTAGKFTAKLRVMAREFSRAMESAANEAGVKDVARDLKAATSAKSMGLDAVKDAAARFEKWDPLKNAARPTAPVVAPTISAPAAATAPMGPATQALADQQAARKAVVQEAAAKLRKVAEPVAAAAPVKAPRARKPKVQPASPDAET
jgi:sec-independent protein translocase protein TatB